MNLTGIWAGWRFYRARQANGFISFISFASTAGIALGVAVLIIALSAMNGFERELEQRFLGVIPQAELIGAAGGIHNWQQVVDSAKDISGISGAAPFIRIEGLVQKDKGFQGLVVNGIDTKLEPKVSSIAQYMSANSWQSLSKNTNNIVLGAALLKKLGLKVGDVLSLYVPNLNQGKFAGLAKAKSHRFVISGTYQLGGEIEQTNAYISMSYAAKLLKFADDVSGVRIKVDNVFQASSLIQELGYKQNQYLYMSDWTRTQGHLYQDIQMVRAVMYLVLVLVIIVACFNIVSTLIMAVRDKAAEIAIFMSIGLKPLSVMSIFMIQGTLNGVLGTLIGGVSGLVIADNLTSIGQGIERLFGIKLLAADIYFIDFLPSKIVPSDVLVVVLISLVLSIVATLYPAYKASKIQPARVLMGH